MSEGQPPAVAHVDCKECARQFPTFKVQKHGSKGRIFASVYLFETLDYVSGLHKTPSCQGMWCRSELKFEGNLIALRSLSCEIHLLLR